MNFFSNRQRAFCTLQDSRRDTSSERRSGLCGSAYVLVVFATASCIFVAEEVRALPPADRSGDYSANSGGLPKSSLTKEQVEQLTSSKIAVLSEKQLSEFATQAQENQMPQDVLDLLK